MTKNMLQKTEINLAILLDTTVKGIQIIDLPGNWREQIPAEYQLVSCNNQPQSVNDCLIWWQGLKKYKMLDYFNRAYDSLSQDGQFICIEKLYLHNEQRPYRPYVLAQAERGRLTRRGPFYLSATCFAEQYVGYGAALGFGFPNSRHVTIAQRLGIYQKLDDIIGLEWDELTESYSGRILSWQNRVFWSTVVVLAGLQLMFCWIVMQ